MGKLEVREGTLFKCRGCGEQVYNEFYLCARHAGSKDAAYKSVLCRDCQRQSTTGSRVYASSLNCNKIPQLPVFKHRYHPDQEICVWRFIDEIVFVPGKKAEAITA